MKQEADGNVEVSEGKLVWYNERYGYGFVRIGDEEEFSSPLDTGQVRPRAASDRRCRDRRPPASLRMARCAPL